ncbi:MAG: hypothetical protein ABW224_00020 [Kibdelosporangium sp.]
MTHLSFTEPPRAKDEHRGHRPDGDGSGFRVAVAAAKEDRDVFTPALLTRPEIGAVTFLTDDADAPRRVAMLRPDLVVAALDGSLPSLGLLHRLRDPRVHQCEIIAVVPAIDARLLKAFERLGVVPCLSEPGDTSALLGTLGTVLSQSFGPVPAGTDPAATGPEDELPTEALVANVLKRAGAALSATDVAERCGFSAVTSRRYLKRLASRGDVVSRVRYRPVGRPTIVYQWVDRLGQANR